MIPFHSLLPDVAQREVRCVHLGTSQNPHAERKLPADEYAYLEYYCADLDCDCRRVLIQVIAKGQPGKVFASITYGWDKESFYRKRTPWDPDFAKATVRGELDPLNEQSEHAEDFLELFRQIVLDAPYRLRLGRHYQMLRQEVARRASARTGLSG